MEYKFLTVRQTAALGILPEYRLRRMIAEKRCPGIYSGNRFMVNVPALIEYLDAESWNDFVWGTNDVLGK